jgi:hypothetical protein
VFGVEGSTPTTPIDRTLPRYTLLHGISFMLTVHILLQLRYTGMLEAVSIRKEGFLYRPTFQEFIEK